MYLDASSIAASAFGPGALPAAIASCTGARISAGSFASPTAAALAAAAAGSTGAAAAATGAAARPAAAPTPSRPLASSSLVW